MEGPQILPTPGFMPVFPSNYDIRNWKVAVRLHYYICAA